MVLSLFGSTGSIGVNTLDVVRRSPDRFHMQYLAAHSRVELLAEQIAEFRPKAVAVADPAAAERLRAMRPNCEILAGPEGLREIAARNDYDTFVGALSGFAGLAGTVEAIKQGKRICLANKESLVVAGEVITPLAARTGSEILPIDSEHSAIYQCLLGETPESIHRIILTASGGPFRTWSRERMESVTVTEALRHPNWVMGRKITIDSATLMNKGLEVIEARWLFDVPISKVDIVVHPQSIIHSFVEFVDGSMKAQLGRPDMRLPIQYALGAPDRLPIAYDRLDLATCGPLEFEPPDAERFPSLKLARSAGEQGGLFPCILNAANEVAVQAFLDGKLRFADIPVLIQAALTMADGLTANALSGASADLALERIFACDARTRGMALELIETTFSVLT
ncbi:MAG: 1-deoxy-D-xylulose-5-phosphate reductoisomerase [Bacteroidota bacterium]|nr:1-deoxy-D-xylulose-5-phosphate reductoisomerase [Bacteroidota bacterium]MDP4232047.1 1-deoxy-D-xylulose-5-phosphate reductoisomerase [Bacteroidota bacterium]MDP4241246.1 1-deoxy-D-xylulose-5-phosphate reductoisomerase [Bacteroidota bacterium]MDP4286638.1 1-deoxy-D-xylulose-5-phosphate reductoisomerase [Bacteroidota bacterium]